jgi:hypothetical protein
MCIVSKMWETPLSTLTGWARLPRLLYSMRRFILMRRRCSDDMLATWQQPPPSPPHTTSSICIGFPVEDFQFKAFEAWMVEVVVCVCCVGGDWEETRSLDRVSIDRVFFTLDS